MTDDTPLVGVIMGSSSDGELGAGLQRILALIVGARLRVIALGVVVGIAVALARIVESLLYGVTPRDPVALAWAAGLLLLTGAAASLVPAWRPVASIPRGPCARNEGALLARAEGAHPQGPPTFN